VNIDTFTLPRPSQSLTSLSVLGPLRHLDIRTNFVPHVLCRTVGPDRGTRVLRQHVSMFLLFWPLLGTYSTSPRFHSHCIGSTQGTIWQKHVCSGCGLATGHPTPCLIVYYSLVQGILVCSWCPVLVDMCPV